LDALILGLLAKDPSERPESATDVLSALDAVDLTEAPPLVKGDGGISDPHALDSLASGVFVGRQKEMGDLKGCLEDALSGRGRLVMLVGEPGIGKSRTAQELTTYAGLRGAQVLWGRSYEEQGVPPYWPWVQAIRSYVRERDPEQLSSEMGSGAAAIAEVVSDVRERLPGLPSPPQLEPDQARFRLFDSISAFLKTASQRQPLVLVLDDLHWADPPSLALLQFVARELGGARLLIIGTYRDMELSRQHPLAEALGELTRERLFQRVLLRGLTQEDVGRFIEMTSGHTAPRGLVEPVHTQTEGNPLFVTEVVRLLVQEGELGTEQVRETDSWPIRIPEGVREVIGRRLNRLSQRCNEALTVASIIGREFTLAQIRPLVEDVAEDRLLEVLEEDLASRVIEELPQSVGRYQFTHALIQETLAGELSTTRKVRLHARVAQALEELYGDDADAAQLAHHFSEAEAILGSENLARYSLLAGERALASYAYEDALAHFERGLVTRGIPLLGTEEAPDEEAAAFLFGLARARSGAYDQSQLGEAFAALSRAFEYYFEAKNVAQAVFVAEYPIAGPGAPITGIAQLIARALTLVRPDSHEAGRLLSRYGGVLGVAEGDYEGSQKALERATSIARREGDVPLEVQTLIIAANVSFQHLLFQESVDNVVRAIELSTSGENDFFEMASRFRTAAGLLRLGDLDAARPHTMALLEIARRRSTTRIFTRISSASILSLSCLEGNWNKGRESSDQGLEVAPRDSNHLLPRALLEYETGEPTQGEIYLDRLLEAMPREAFDNPEIFARISMALPAIARITGLPNRLEIDKTAAEQVIAERVVSEQSVRPITILNARVALALLAVHNSSGSSAEKQYDHLLGQRGTIIETMISVDRLLALLSQTMANLDQAAAHFEDALAFCRKAGYQPELAWTCCDYADMLKERNAEGDHAKAITLLDESLAISSELGMRPLTERVLSRREILKA